MLAIISNQARKLLPSRPAVYQSVKLLAMAFLGSVVLYPFVFRLPVLGWDWYFFFTAHHPTDNIFSLQSPFFPYTKYIVQLFLWMDWRQSLALLNSITLVTVALSCWRVGGRYLSIVLAIVTPPMFYVMWVGHPDGLALLGVLTGIIPLALIKPQVTVWRFLIEIRLFFWTAVILLLTILVWPYWFQHVSSTVWDHSSSFGWQALGWPVFLCGCVLLAGAGNHPWRIMAAGCFLSPDLMPYHLVVLLPALGIVKGYRQLLLFLTIWLSLPGVALGGPYRWLNLLFPLAVYGLNHSKEDYWANVKALLNQTAQVIRLFHLKPTQMHQ